MFPIGPVKNLGSADAADSFINGDWDVTGTVIRTSDSITVDGNVSVKGTLVLDDSNLTIDGTISERHGITIEAGGRLVLKNDTVLKGPTGGRFSFFAKALSLVRIENSTVIGCGFPTGLVSEMGVYSESSNFVIQNSTIGSGQNGLMAKGGTFSITSSTVIEMVSSGITLLEKSMMNGSSLMVRHIQGPGLLSDDSIIRLDGSVFENVEISIDALNSTCAVNQSLLSTRTMDVFRLEGGSCIMQDVRPFLPGMDRGLLVSGPSGADLLLVNCSISDVAVVGSKATARWANRFDVIVTRNGGAPGAGAELEFLDRFGSRTAVGLTGSLGYAQDIIVPFYTKNQTFSSFLTPHNLSVFLEGALRFADVNVSLVDHVRIRVLFSTPEITIDAPGDGEWLKGSPVKLKAVIVDPRPITDIWLAMDDAGEVHVDGAEELSMDLNLPDGWHTLKIKAANDDDRVGSANVEFGIDSEDPIIRLDPSSLKAYTNQSILRLKGACSDDATIWVSGQMYPVIDGRFDIARMLQEGMNRIVVTALDRAQNRDEEVVTVTLDSIPPTVLISNPADMTTIRDRSVTIKGICDPSTVKVSVNGIETSIMDGHFEYEIKELMEGSNHIRISAIDITGSTTVKMLTVFVDTVPPQITLSGFPSLTNQASMVLRGMTDTEGAIVYVQGVPAEMDGLSFSMRIDLEPRDNYIEIRAQDPAGNVFVLNKVVFLDHEDPAFEMIDPVSGTVLRDSILNLKVQVFDESGIRMVKAIIPGKSTIELREEEYWTGVIILSKGENSITLEAVDRAGNSALERATFTYKPIELRDDVKPRVWFNAPPDRSVWNEGLINIEGGSSDNVGVVKVELVIDKVQFQVNGTDLWHASIELQKGGHSLRATAVDAEGNFNTSVVYITVVVPGKEIKPKDDDQTFYIIAGVVLILVLAAVLAYLYSSNKKMRRLVEERARAEEEKARKMPKNRVISNREGPSDRRPVRRMGGPVPPRQGPRAPQRGPRTK